MAAPVGSLDFLDGPFSVPRAGPINVFSLAGFPRRETVASNVLAYFFDPNERHGFGPAFVDALVGLLDGSMTHGDANPARFASYTSFNSTEWAVATEVSTPDRKRIDILLTNDELDLAIVIENKLDAAVYNPFDSYIAHAKQSYGTVLALVLAPTQRALGAGVPPAVSAVTYDALFDASHSARNAAANVDERSRELLTQFIENTSEKRQQMAAQHEQQALDHFWAAIEPRQGEVQAFFKALDGTNAALKARAHRLQTLADEQLDLLGLRRSSFVTAAYERSWGRNSGRVALVYLGFEFTVGGGIELLLGWYPPAGRFGFTVKAYAQRSRPNHTRPGWDYIPLGLALDTPDDLVVERFVALAGRASAGLLPADGPEDPRTV